MRRQGPAAGSVLTPGQAHDLQGFFKLFRMIAERSRALLGDRSYDADDVLAEIAITGVEAVIPPKITCRAPTPTTATSKRNEISSNACSTS